MYIYASSISICSCEYVFLYRSVHISCMLACRSVCRTYMYTSIVLYVSTNVTILGNIKSTRAHACMHAVHYTIYPTWQRTRTASIEHLGTWLQNQSQAHTYTVIQGYFCLDLL